MNREAFSHAIGGPKVTVFQFPYRLRFPCVACSSS